MFERFTNSARLVIVASQREARALTHNQIAPGHLLLGVATVEDATGAAVLAALGVESEALRQQVIAKYDRSESELPGHIPFTDAAKTALEHSLRESLAMDHTYISSEHVLLGLTKDPAGDTAEMFAALGVDTDAVRDEAMARLGSAGGIEPTEP
jgi:ATP-dependent Clp protease ATP-binding subunit ClpC